MKIKRYFAADIRQAIRLVREEQGPDAVILSNRSVEGGVEIVSAVDYDESLFEEQTAESVAPPTVKPAVVATQSEQRSRFDDHFRDDEYHPAPTPQKRVNKGAADRSSRAVPEKRAEQMRQNRVAPPTEAAVSPAGRQISGSTRTHRAPQMEWSQDPVLVGMKNELTELRGLVEQQLSGFAWGSVVRQHPLHARLMRQLMTLGLSAQESKQIAAAVNEKQTFDQAWRLALAIMEQRLMMTEDDILSDGGMVALVGPTGVGKTTAIAKLAARYTLRHGAGRVALITTDNYRIGAQEQLRTFGQILGAPVYVAKNYQELAQTIEAIDDKDLILIDTAGMNPQDLRLTEQLSQLRSSVHEVKCYLVLSANSQAAGLEVAVNTFEKVGLQGCIISKIDETTSLGEVLSTVLTHNLPIAYISDGQQVPEDLHPARSHDLVARCLAMAEKQNNPLSDEMVELQYGKVAMNANV